MTNTWKGCTVEAKCQQGHRHLYLQWSKLQAQGFLLVPWQAVPPQAPRCLPCFPLRNYCFRWVSGHKTVIKSTFFSVNSPVSDIPRRDYDYECIFVFPQGKVLCKFRVKRTFRRGSGKTTLLIPFPGISGCRLLSCAGMLQMTISSM